MRNFNPHSTHPARAVQAWQILVGKAINRQTVTYEGLSVLMYRKKAAGVLDRILGHVAFYCMDHALPPLTAIVVGKHRGEPGADIPVPLGEIDEERERVYKRDWYDIYPANEDELAAAFSHNMV
jgi:hypothetical protein